MAPKRPASSKSSSPAKKYKKDEDDVTIVPDLEVPESLGGTPLAKLFSGMLAASKLKPVKPEKDGVVVYWMR